MKTFIFYSIFFIALLGLLRLSTRPPLNEPRKHRPGRRLVLRPHSARSTSKHEHVAFDPLVAELERRSEHPSENATTLHHGIVHTEHAPGLESQPDPWGDDYESYLNDEEHFNLSQRLAVLFPQLDVDPMDGFVSLKELQDWHVKQALKDALYRSNRELQMKDTDKDGLVSFKEYLPSLSGEDLDDENKKHNGAGWWKEYFDVADADKDSFLNQIEFFNFLHPHDGNNSDSRLWSRSQQFKSRDHDNDGKINLLEFDQHLFDFLIDHDASSPTEAGFFSVRTTDRETRMKAKFKELDTNNDGFLSDDEFEPIMDKLQPGEAFYAKLQARYLLEEADTNRDGRLSLKEMLEHPYIFYSTVYPQDEQIHDEFR